MVAPDRSGHRSGVDVIGLVQQEPVVRVLVGDADPLAGLMIAQLLSADADIAVVGSESGALTLTSTAETFPGGARGGRRAAAIQGTRLAADVARSVSEHGGPDDEYRL